MACFSASSVIKTCLSIDLCLANEQCGVVMRTVVYAKARKRSRVGNSPSACRATPAGRQEYRRGNGNRGDVRVFGKTLEASPETRRHGGIESQTASGAKQFQVRYHPCHVWKILRDLGWTSHKPEQQARESDDDAIARWRTHDWSRIKRGREKR